MTFFIIYIKREDAIMQQISTEGILMAILSAFGGFFLKAL